MGNREVLALFGWVFVSFLPSMAGAVFKPGAWYEALEKPSWTPPGWVFGPVWTVLYLLMGLAAWLVWRERARAKGVAWAMGAFVVQLSINATWSPLFFGMRSPGWAFVSICVLLVCVLLTIVLFWRVSRTAGQMLVPYAAWVAFALVLNGVIYQLNRAISP